MSILKAVLIFSISFNALAVRSHLTCSKQGTHIIAINGVGINDRKFNQFKQSSINLLDQALDKSNIDQSSESQPVTLSVHHNRSYNVLYDGYETWKLYMQRRQEETGVFRSKELILRFFMYFITSNPETRIKCQMFAMLEECDEIARILSSRQTSEDLKNINIEIDKQIKSGRKLIFFSHSAGAIFTDHARDYIKATYPDFDRYTAHLALARPFHTNHRNVLDLTFVDDEITEGLRKRYGSLVPPANLSKSNSCLNPDNTNDPFVNHDFVYCYMGNTSSKLTSESGNILDSREYMPAIDQVKDGLYRVASFLNNNDEKCCNKIPGKIWRNKRGDFGGFVLDDSEIHDDVVIEKGVNICGESKLGFVEGKISKLTGPSNIHGNLILDGNYNLGLTNLTKKSRLTSNGHAGRTLYIDGLNLDGKLDFINNMNIHNSTVKGDFVLEPGVVIGGGLDNTTLHADLPSKIKAGRIAIEDSTIVGNLNVNIEEFYVVSLNAANTSINLENLNMKVNFQDVILEKASSITSISSSYDSNLVFENIHANDSFSLTSPKIEIKDVQIEKPFTFFNPTHSARIYRTNIFNNFYYSGNNFYLADSDVVGNFYATNDCEDHQMSFNNLILNEGNTFLNGVSISPSWTTSPHKVQVSSSLINGNDCNRDPLFGRQIFAISPTNSAFSGFTGIGSGFISGSIGNGVNVESRVRDDGYLESPGVSGGSIADGTSIIAPVSAYGCNLSGNVGPNYNQDCRD